nr:thioredoxin domain-containing protein [Acidimicrobiia bacterium]
GGGFYSAEDADSLDETGHSVEGAFYTWTPDEARAVLVAGGLAGDEITTVTEWFGITGEPNFEERSIPNRLHARGQWARPDEIERGRQLLFDARATRPRPGLDDKVLTEWNAMMIGALAEAGFVFDESAWIDLAVESGEFLLDELRGDDGRWSRSWHEDAQPHARHRALAADHAALVDAFVRLGEASGQARWTTAAVEVADAMLDHFWDVGDGGLFTVPDDGPADGTPLIVRQKDVVDGAVPSANSTAALGLGRLAALTGEPRFAQHADRILTLMAPLMQSSPTAFCVALAALDQRRTGIVEVVVPGSEHELLDALRSTWRPEVVLAHGEPFDSPLWEGRLAGNAYVCEHGACQLPVTDANGLEQQLADRHAAP